MEGKRLVKWVVRGCGVVVLGAFGIFVFFGALIFQRDRQRQKECEDTLSRATRARLETSRAETQLGGFSELTEEVLGYAPVWDTWSDYRADVRAKLKAGQTARWAESSETVWVLFFDREGRASSYLCFVT